MKQISILKGIGITTLCFSLLQGTSAAQQTNEPEKERPAGDKQPAVESADAATAKKEAQIDPEAKELLSKAQQAYNNLDRVEFSGQVSVNIEAGTIQEKTNQQFTSSFEAPNKFRHKSQDALTIGSNGDKAYVFNETANSYAWLETPSGRASMQQLPSVIPQILQTQNPSLLFALSTNSIQEVVESFGIVNKIEDETIGGKAYPRLQLISDKNGGKMTMSIDPETDLVRQLTVDFSPSLKESGAKDVKVATVTVDYSTIKTDPTFEPKHFAWTPPKDAMDLREAAGAQRPAQREESSLIGKPAPNFTLTDLDGKKVSLADLKGQVVVLDFWASWCGPCVQSLPKVAKLYQNNKKEKVKVFAVNLQEDKSTVEEFMDKQSIDIPVLLDEDGSVAEQYGVQAIPQTVVIGADGKIKEVSVGAGPNSEEELRTAVQSAKAGIK